jgi:hypothetical protein
VFRIGGNTFYDRKNKIPMKIPEFKRSGIGLIAEFRGILNGFPNQAQEQYCSWLLALYKEKTSFDLNCKSVPENRESRVAPSETSVEWVKKFRSLTRGLV